MSLRNKRPMKRALRGLSGIFTKRNSIPAGLDEMSISSPLIIQNEDSALSTWTRKNSASSSFDSSNSSITISASFIEPTISIEKVVSAMDALACLVSELDDIDLNRRAKSGERGLPAILENDVDSLYDRYS
jgi:hypothetical protein